MRSLNLKGNCVYVADNLQYDINKLLKHFGAPKIFVLSDDNSYRCCMDSIKSVDGISPERIIKIPAGEKHKNIDTVTSVWQRFVKGGADRHSMLINVGGGVVCDLGGFAASTFKRGMAFINVPTTLLAQVDASVGGKTGVNFMELKNEIGIVSQPKAVLLNSAFLESVDRENILSGFAEMIKHALLKGSNELEQIMSFDIETFNLNILENMIAESVAIKDAYAHADPYEKDIRKALNLGHTVGHALESLAMKQGKPLLHGYAVAFGLVAELYLSHLQLGFDASDTQRLKNYTKNIYHLPDFTPSDFQYLYNAMLHDKKNRNGQINFALLKKAGEPVIDVRCSKKEVIEALEFCLNF